MTESDVERRRKASGTVIARSPAVPASTPYRHELESAHKRIRGMRTI
jgi:hypothetical protein